MITFIYGQNQFQISHEIKQIITKFNDPSSIERFDESSTEAQLFDALNGLSLFSSKKLIIIKNISANTALWAYLDELLDDVSPDIHLAVIESSPDKRTKTFKHLIKAATVIEAKQPTENEAIQWLTQSRTDLTPQLAGHIVNKIGTDQLQLHFALEKLTSFKSVNKKIIDEVIEPTIEANIFDLVDAVMNGKTEVVYLLVEQIKRSQDAYQLFGLLTSQIFNLITLHESDKSPTDVARDLGTHPYPLQKLHSLTRKLNKKKILLLVNSMTKIDDQLKRSGADQWDIVEAGLLRLSQLMK